MNIKLFIFLFVLLVMVILIWWFSPQNWFNKIETPQVGQEANLLPEQTKVVGNVTITVKPVNILADSSEWFLGLTLNTHTQELDYDLVRAATLRDDTGKTFKPKNYQGDPPGGHHRSGLLVFSPITPYPKSLELVLDDIGTTTPQSFKWQLGN